jgi:hypothetical protein
MLMINRRHVNGKAICAATNIVSTAIAAFIVYYSGYYEPFFAFSYRDGSVHVLLGALTFITIALATMWTIRGVRRGALSRMWIWAIIYETMLCILLLWCIIGYILDISGAWH